jgi:hypothetical protein
VRAIFLFLIFLALCGTNDRLDKLTAAVERYAPHWAHD